MILLVLHRAVYIVTEVPEQSGKGMMCLLSEAIGPEAQGLHARDVCTSSGACLSAGPQSCHFP